MDHRCPRCESLTDSGICPRCGSDSYQFWATRARWALAVAAAASSLGTLVTWLQLADLERYRNVLRSATSELRTGVFILAGLTFLVLVGAVLSRSRPLVGACIAAAATTSAALVPASRGSFWLWTTYLTAAPVGAFVALVAAVLGCIWAHRAGAPQG